jgi:serine/threonine protein kinase
MGEVHRARDRKLDRDVAIKVLRSVRRSRYRHSGSVRAQGESVAALSHPNIPSIFDFGAEAGITYAVMELPEGHAAREA